MLDATVANVLLMLLCYGYIVVVIFVSGRLEKPFNISRKSSRKFLHAMIGNLPFAIPFFTIGIFSFFGGCTVHFGDVSCLSYTPLKSISRRLKGLSGISEEGHPLGLVFYAISYAVLALLLPQDRT